MQSLNQISVSTVAQKKFLVLFNYFSMQGWISNAKILKLIVKRLATTILNKKGLVISRSCSETYPSSSKLSKEYLLQYQEDTHIIENIIDIFHLLFQASWYLMA